ncbi:MAG: isopentenyl-diphosphate Delta-isomerase [Acidobacteriota bacterium]|nr:isopentenyl-diphosphate Delta-isomerase [Acidobacteriota bacterium]
MTEDLLILVDEEDIELGFLDKAACHNGNGVKHRAFSVFLFDERGRLLLQQRAPGKRLWHSFWSNTCCSHPRKGEATEAAAHRRLLEELGVTVDRLEHIYGFSYEAGFGDEGSENEYCHVFFGRLRVQPVVNEEEIQAVRWMTVAELDEALAAAPDNFTPWFKQEWATIKNCHAAELSVYALLA